jgi:Tol biopolymer transport system component/DNA-binding winged helix-turn-helix (wHTH) protein
MASLGTPPGLIRFGPYALDPVNRELRMRGFLVRLQPQQIAVLLLLVDRAGQIVSREDIHQHIWGNDTFVDFERGINFSINQIRAALGDDADKPRYIQTIPRRGYRFIGSVEKPAEEPPPANGANATSRKRYALWIGISVAAAMVLVAAIPSWRTFRKTEQLPSIEVVPLVALRGAQGSPAFSPDGNQVAFEGYEGEDGGIYTALVGGDKPLRLTVKSGACCPAWSPDNRQIAFMRFSKEGLSINAISALGGAEKRLYSSKAHAIRDFCVHLDWSPDGKLLAFGEPTDNLGFRLRIALISLDDLSVRPLTSPPQQEFDCEPAFSPDGSEMAFERGSVGGFGKDLFLIPVRGGELRRLTFDNAWGGSPAWTQGGSDIVFASMRGGPMNLWRISAKGGTPQPVAGISALAYHPSIPRRGNLLAYEHGSSSSGIWQINLTDKVHSVGSPIQVITAKGMINWRPSFSPDGKNVVFESDRLGHSDIWYCHSDGSDCAQLTSLRGTAGTARWSPDGHRIAFEFQSQRYYDVYVMDVPDGRPRRLATFAGTDNGAPNWSRDGQWIYFYSSREKGPLQLWKVPFQGGTPVRVTKNGGVYASESADGRFLYYSKLEQPGIWRMPLTGGEEQRVVDQPSGFQWFNWALSAQGLYLTTPVGPEKMKLEFFDFAAEKKTLVGYVEKLAQGLALAPDGKSLLYARTNSEDYEIMLVKNFH